MVCPIWNGVDTSGRTVCPDSFWTKNAGCNSAEDRVVVENNQRPQYMEYINLSANGIDGAMYGNTMPWTEVGKTTQSLNDLNNITGNFGSQFGANVYPACGYYPYQQALNQVNQVQAPVQSNQMQAMMPPNMPQMPMMPNMQPNQMQAMMPNMQPNQMQAMMPNMPQKPMMPNMQPNQMQAIMPNMHQKPMMPNMPSKEGFLHPQAFNQRRF